MKKKSFFNIKILGIIILAIAISFSAIFLVESGEAETNSYDGIAKAAIIDQLHEDFPNENYHEQAKKYLNDAGYEVDVFTTEDITVEFFKELPKMNYKFIVMRTHGIGDIDQTPVSLFTGQRYTEQKYIAEQLSGQVQKGTPLLELNFKPDVDISTEWEIINETTRILKSPAKLVDNTKDEYFVIPPKFVEEAMNGKFPETIFVLGGCSTMANPSMAQSLIDRGASEVIGWDDQVAWTENDMATLMFLEETLANGLETEKAVNKVMENLVERHYSKPNLKYFSNSNT